LAVLAKAHRVIGLSHGPGRRKSCDRSAPRLRSTARKYGL